MEKHKPTHTDSSSPLSRRVYPDFSGGLGEAYSSAPPSEGQGEALSSGGGFEEHYKYIEVVIQGSVVWLNLNRPDRHNALVPDMISEMKQALDDISSIDQLLFVIISGNGPSFCAGADLNWFSGLNQRSTEESAAQFKMLADLLMKLFKMPQITIAIAKGKVFGGGIGLMAACDFVLAESFTRFRFSEVKLGLLPATILPFVSKRISIQNLRKWILTGNLFTISEAHQAGLVDSLYVEDQLEPALYELLASFEAASPSAIKKAKTLINQLAAGDIDFNDTALTSTILAKAIVSVEGQEGIHAFLEKRKPNYNLIPNPKAPLNLPEGETSGN